MSVKDLPNWSIPDLHPAFFDNESATTIEMVAKLYGKIQTLIEAYNTLEKELSDDVKEAYEYLKTNLKTTCEAIINQMIKQGDFTVALEYDENNEALNIILSEVK